MRLSGIQRRTLGALDPAILRQFEDLHRRDGVSWKTLASLLAERPDRPALARRVELRSPGILREPYHVFYVLTPAGAVVRGHAA